MDKTAKTSYFSLDYIPLLKKKGRSSLRIILFTLLFLISILGIGIFMTKRETAKQTTPKKTAKISGWLTTSGGKLLDNEGREIMLRGINYGELMDEGYVYIQKDVSNEPEVCRRWVSPPTTLHPDDVERWGFNVVRLPVAWARLEPDAPIVQKDGTLKHTWNENYVKAIDRTIAELGKRNIAVILDMHQYLWSSAFRYIDSEDGWGCAGGGFPAWLYPRPEKTTFQKARCDFFQGKKEAGNSINPQQGFIEAWQYLAGTYQGSPTVVGADIINEPWSAKDVCSSQSLLLNTFYKKVGSAIRKVNPNILLIFEDSQDTGDNQFALTDALPFDNTMYSFHLYTGNWRPDGITRLEKYRERSQKWKVPLFIGEFDAFGRADNLRKLPLDSQWKKDMQEVFTYMRQNDMHWAFWAYSGLHSLLIPETSEVKTELLSILQSGF